MKILITSPLFPPDIAEPAAHVKELARRLSIDFDTSVATYGTLPEKVENVPIHTTSKRRPLLVRLFLLTLLLMQHGRSADIVYSENGPSVELPVFIFCALFRKPLLLHIGDTKAYTLAQENTVHRFIHRLVEKQAKAVIEHRTRAKPEILPFGESVVNKVTLYNKEWERHIGEIEYHARKYDESK